ncbi:c-type cytochrome [Alcaligenes sp. SDU_A2]|uniref:c-type cytochrome n=1 Tax=Alcaligenes sp. SDU_A2 TaxID=3136634 RepID=UPI00311DB256
MLTGSIVLAWGALLLRLLHWLGIAMLLAVGLTWLSQRSVPLRPRRMAATGLLLATLAAAGWPVLYALAVFAPTRHWEVLASLGMHTAAAWFPPLSSLTALQPPWPLAWRPDPDIPVSYHALSQIRQSILVLVVGLSAVLATLIQNRLNAALLLALATGAGTLWLQPRPELLLVQATPDSFRQPLHPLHVDQITVGQGLYEQTCLHCHGVGGQNPTRQPDGRWPALLGPSLFSNRPAGDLLWHVRHGDPSQNPVAPWHAAGAELSDQAIWQILDYLRLSAAGTEARQDSGWQHALQAPDLPLSCAHRAAADSLHSLRGRILRIVAYDTQGPPLYPDPLLFTIALSRSPMSVSSRPSGADCVAQSSAAWHAYALIAGRHADQLAGTQFLVDRQGWLRSLAAPDAASGWSRPDSMCLPGQAPAQANDASTETLLRRIDMLTVEPPLYRPAPS